MPHRPAFPRLRGLAVGTLLHLLPLLLVGAGVEVAHGADTTNRFGFKGKEIFPIDFLITHLRAADLDGDQLTDLVVVNNARSRINLLYNQTGRTNELSQPQPVRGRRDINELPPDSRFRIESLPSEKRIASLAVTDLNNDQRPDIAYFGEPKELIVQYNEGTGGWSTPKRWTLEEGLLNPNALVHGDLNGDGREDLLLLADGFIYWMAQDPDGSLSEPEKLAYSGTVQAAQILDIQGDGLQDLLLVNWESPNPFRFRLQTPDHQLSPEVHFVLPPIRSYWADDLDGDHRTEVVTVAQKSGRAQVYNFHRKSAPALSDGWKQGQFEVLPLRKTGKARRGLIWADVSGDRLPDLLVAEPDSGQLTAHLQNADGTLGPARTFASLVDISDLSVADWDADGTSEIFLLSNEERQLGVTRLDRNGKIPFPKALPLEGRPLVMAAGVLQPGSPATLAAIVDLDGRRELTLSMAEGRVSRQKLAESFKANPTSLSIHDVDHDGLPDLIVLIPYEKIKVLRQGADLKFEEIDIAPPGGTVEQPWFTATDVDGDGKEELLLAQKNFLRAVVLQRDPTTAPGDRPPWSFTVKEQINGAGGNSRIVAATSLSTGRDRVPSLFLLDAEKKALTLSQRDPTGTWQIRRNIPLPSTEFQTLAAINLGGSDFNAVALLGAGAVAWMHLDGEVWDLAELDGYETPLRDAFLNDVVSGDLNQDGRRDLVFLETARNHVDIVTFEEPHQLVPAQRWQVFEERTFRARRADSGEPREAIIADFNHDAKNDLAVLVHDRVIVYLQE